MNTSLAYKTDWLSADRFIAIKEIQQKPNLLFDGRRVITSNGKPKGISFSLEEREHVLEDIQALQSEMYQKKIAASRITKKLHSREEVLKEFNLSVKK